MSDFTLKELQKELRDLIVDSPFATGIDISSWREKFDIDTENLLVILLMLDFVVLRMGYGGWGSKRPEKDKKFDEYWQELLDHPEIIRMFYWYFQSETPWEDQLEFVCSMLDDLGDDWEAFWLDLEGINNKKSAGFALTAVRFLKAMRRRYPNKKIGVYANRYFYNSWLKAYTNDIDNFPLYIAAYPWSNWLTNLTAYFYNWWEKVFATLTNRPVMPKGRGENNWEIWQIGDRTGFGKFLGTGTRDVDFNITRRTKSQFVEWLGKPKRWGNVPDVPNVPGGDEPEEFTEWQERAMKLLYNLKNANTEFGEFEDLLTQMIEKAESLKGVIRENI